MPPPAAAPRLRSRRRCPAWLSLPFPPASNRKAHAAVKPPLQRAGCVARETRSRLRARESRRAGKDRAIAAGRRARGRETAMKVGEAIAEIMKREGIDILT